VNSGYTDALAAESLMMKQYYINAGIEEERIVLTGALYDDESYLNLQKTDINRKRLYQSLKLDNDKPMLLTALPPDQTASKRKGFEYTDYQSFIRQWIETLCQYAKDYNIIVNLHPRIMPEAVAFIHDYPVKISTKQVFELIPMAEIYVACCSATIRTAIACSLPVLNYDAYQYHYSDYETTQGVLTVFDKRDYADTLHQLVSDEDYFMRIKTLQIEASRQWAMLDGNCSKRLLKLFDDLTSTQEAKAATHKEDFLEKEHV